MSPAPRLGVAGSAHIDWAVTTPTLPRPGETVLGGDLRRSIGGKGANQAVAAARLGAATSFIGCVGRDDPGNEVVASLVAAGVNTQWVVRSNHPTGAALIIATAAGENVIVVSPGADADATVDHAELQPFDGLLVQLETPVSVLERVLARHHRVIVNAAPANAAAAELLGRCAVVIVNEVEAADLRVRDIGCCVITKGAAGAEIWRDGRRTNEQGAPVVDVVDSVGAGDAFVAAFTTRYLVGDADADVLRYAVCAGSLATLGAGAHGALPTDAEVHDWLRRGW